MMLQARSRMMATAGARVEELAAKMRHLFS